MNESISTNFLFKRFPTEQIPSSANEGRSINVNLCNQLISPFIKIMYSHVIVNVLNSFAWIDLLGIIFLSKGSFEWKGFPIKSGHQGINAFPQFLSKGLWGNQISPSVNENKPIISIHPVLLCFRMFDHLCGS